MLLSSRQPARAVLVRALGLAAALALPLRAANEPNHSAGFETIQKRDMERHVLALAAAPLEGRDSPSAGLARAADYIAAAFAEMGLVPPGQASDYRAPFPHNVQVPVPEECALELQAGDERVAFTYGADLVPVPYCSGRASGPPVFVGFGISSSSERYDDLRGGELEGCVAVLLEGEPRHKKLFEGAEVTADADLYSKLATLYKRKVEGVLVVRRPAVEGEDGAGRERVEGPKLGFRHTFASWPNERPRAPTGVPLPVLEVTPAVASRIVGVDVLDLAERIDRSGRPIRKAPKDHTVSLASGAREGSAGVDNVLGVLPGSDAELAGEYVVVGAHYDHVGTDARGRIAFGADDNASGTAGMLEIAAALAAARPRRSILVCAFAAEEDGLLGSKALARDLPVPRERVVAMINLDMIGRGDADEVAVLGVVQNPGFDDLLERANRLAKTRIKKLVTRRGEELFQRSDHYSFHEIGVPVLFFFEGLPIEKNKDYHTWRDTLDKLDLEKMERTARLAYNAAWLLANDDERPPKPHD